MKDLVAVLRWRRAQPGELGGGGLWSVIPERTFVALDKSELVGRMRREVDAGRLPGMALAAVDSGVSVEILKQVGYSAEDLRKAAREVENLFKGRAEVEAGASERLLRREHLEPARRPSGAPDAVVEPELERVQHELARLRKVERALKQIVAASDGARSIDAALRAAKAALATDA